MNTYLFLYFGGSQPESPEDGKAMMEAWTAYYSKLGDRIIDEGAPFGEKATVGGDTQSNATGYTIVMAGDIAEAKALTEDHPHLDYGGTIEVLECLDMSMDMNGDEDEEEENEEDEDEVSAEAV